MHVLQLTNARSPFFDSQLAALDAVGVTHDTRVVAGATGERGPGDYLRFLPTAVAAAARGDYDAVHANYGLLGPAALAAPGRPVVVTLWGSDVMGPAWLRRLSERAAARADAVIAPSSALADAVDVATTVVPFGVDTTVFRPKSRARAREAVGWPRGETVALFPYDAAREVKNYPLAEAVVERAATDVTLRTVSGVPHERMADYFNASDLLLVTSEREAGPMVIKEAAACDLPVVSTDVGFAAEVLDGVANSRVASSTAALAAAVDDVVATGGRSDGSDVVDGLSLAEMGASLRAVYESA